MRSVSSGEDDSSSTMRQIGALEEPELLVGGVAGGRGGRNGEADHLCGGAGAPAPPPSSAGMRAKSSSSVRSIAGV